MIPLAKFAMLRARAAARAIAFFGSATSTGTNVTMPASVLANDIAILVDGAVDITTTPPSSVTPSGWSAIGSSVSTTLNGDSASRVNVSRKVLVGSEGGSSIAGMSEGIAQAKVLLVFRPSSGTWEAASSVNAVAQDTTISNQTVTVGAAPGIVIGWAYDGYESAAGLGMSPAADATISVAGSALQVGRRIYNSAPVNNTVSTTMGASPGGAMGSFWLPLGA